MYVEHHDLHHEFPEFSERIHELKVSNHHFARLFEDYHRVTASIEDLEHKDIPVDDYAFEELKKQRLKLKDELHAMLSAPTKAG